MTADTGHPFEPHPLDPAGVKAAEHLATCDEPYCVAVRERLIEMTMTR